MTSDTRETEDEKWRLLGLWSGIGNKKGRSVLVLPSWRQSGDNEDIVILRIIIGVSELIKMIKGRSFICKNEGCNYRQEVQLSCPVFDKDTIYVRAGEKVTIQGHIDIQKHKGKMLTLFYANSVSYERSKEPEITSKDIEAFKRFAKMPKPIDRLVSMFAPDVVNLKAPNILGQLGMLDNHTS